MPGEEIVQKWYYARDGQRYGPVPTGRVKKMLRDGGLSEEDLIWRRGMDTWTPLSETSLLEEAEALEITSEETTAPPEPPPETPGRKGPRVARDLDRQRTWLEATARIFNLIAALGGLLVLGGGFLAGFWFYKGSQWSIALIAASVVGAALVFSVFKAGSAALHVQEYMEARQRTMMMRINELHDQFLRESRPDSSDSKHE